MDFKVLFAVLQHWRWRWVLIGFFAISALPLIAIAQNDLPGEYSKQNTDNKKPSLVDEKSALTLRGAVNLALEHNPELAASAKEIRALGGVTLQAGLLPNPSLQINLEDISTSSNSPGARFTSIRIGQLIETGGKRSARANAALLGQEWAGQNYETRRLDLIAQVANVFTGVLAGQERLRLASEGLELAQKVVNTVKRRVYAGKAPPIEETNAKVAFGTMKIEYTQAQRDLIALRKELALLWGNQAPNFEEVLGDLESFVEIPDFEALVERVHANPSIIGGKINLEQRKALLKLEKARRLPDITVSAGVRRYAEPHDTTALVGFSVPLPLFNRNQGNLLEAHQRVDKAIDEQTAIDLQIRTLLVQTYEALMAAHNEINMLRVEILPGARDAFIISRKGYELGKFGFLVMLDAQRTLFQNQALYLRALANYQRLVNEIERLIAEPIDGVAN